MIIKETKRFLLNLKYIKNYVSQFFFSNSQKWWVRDRVGWVACLRILTKKLLTSMLQEDNVYYMIT